MGSCRTMDAEEMPSTTVNVTSPQPRTDEVAQSCFDLRVFYVRVSNYMGRREYLEGEGELSRFNAGVRVGVGISIGFCLGVGVGVGLLSITYQKAYQSLARRLL